MFESSDLFNYHWWRFWYYNWWFIYGEPIWHFYSWHLLIGGPILALVACRLLLPRWVWKLVAWGVFHWLPLGAIVYGVSWASWTWLPRLPLGGWEQASASTVTGGALLLFLNHIRAVCRRLNTTIRQAQAQELFAFHERRKKLLETFSPEVVDYGAEGGKAHATELAWYEGDGPKLHWFMHTRRRQNRIIKEWRNGYPTMMARLDADEKRLTEFRDKAREIAPTYARFLNDYAKLLVKFTPGTRGVDWIPEADHRHAVNYLAYHLRWRGEVRAIEGCNKCQNGQVWNRKLFRWDDCDCLAQYKALMSKASDAAVLKMVYCDADKLPAWMYDFIEARIDHLATLVGKNVPIDELVKTADKLLTERYIKHHQEAGNVILGEPVSIPGVYDATYDLPVVTTPEEMTKHGYLRGKTGAGKTTTIQYRVTQMFHIPTRGVVMMSPERSLFARRLFPYIPKARFNDVIYINPFDIEGQVIGFNPVILHRGEDVVKKTSQLAVAFERALGDFGVSMLPLFQVVAGTLLRRPNSSVLDIRSLLNVKDDSFRREVIRSSVMPQEIREFWTEYDDDSYYHSASRAVVNRMRPMFSEPLRTFITTDAIDWNKELNEHARLIFLDTSDLEEGSVEIRIIAQLLIAQFLAALKRRDDWPEERYIPYSMLIDEFWQFTSGSVNAWAAVFNQMRKYFFDVTPAHQVSDNIPAAVIGVILKNVGTVTAMELAHTDGALFSREQQFTDPTGRARPDVYQNLRPGQGVVKTPNPAHRTGRPVSVRQEPLVPRNPDYEFETMVALSKKNFGKKPEVRQRLIEDDPPPLEAKKAEPKRTGGKTRKHQPPPPPQEEWQEELL